MARPNRLGAVILAAGASARMGREKALLPWPPLPLTEPAPDVTHTFIGQHIELLSLHATTVLVVLGTNFDALAEKVEQLGAVPVLNPQPQRGQFSSLQVAVQAAQKYGREAVFVTPVDRPPVAETTLAVIKHAWLSAPEQIWAVVPQCGPRHGHPIVAGQQMMAAWLAAPASETARAVEHAHQKHIRYAPVTDPLVTININTHDDYARLAAELRAAGVRRQ